MYVSGFFYERKWIKSCRQISYLIIFVLYVLTAQLNKSFAAYSVLPIQEIGIAKIKVKAERKWLLFPIKNGSVSFSKIEVYELDDIW
ncbi:hypothetical protein [Abyssalbus ytuae]|uniref:Uncharacterized protein n=1 Tax=Abyssalbus ytuae TaxID=2926907 RepID=A0A9E6ZX62_9FLAO|nr:hypothetical protein [Abyssalbus ytuae]UOB18466.1 hypothetical protein MQE35_04040 [Abyssalbus ytuae]